MEFEYKKNKILANLIFGFIFLLFTIFITIMILRTMILDWSQFTNSKIVFGIASICLFSFLTYLYLGTAIVRHKYFQLNNKVEIKLDKQNQKIIILDKQNNNQTEINFENVKSVELYYSWNTNPFSSDLGYSKLNIENSNPIIVTQNNLNQYHIYKSFKNKVTKNKSNFLNTIKT